MMHGAHIGGQRAGVRYWITARLTKAVRRAIKQIPDDPAFRS